MYIILTLFQHYFNIILACLVFTVKKSEREKKLTKVHYFNINLTLFLRRLAFLPVQLVMNSVGTTGLTSVTSGASVDALGDDTGGGGGAGDTVATQITGTSDDDDDVPSSPGSFGEDEGSLPGDDDVTAQLAAAGGWPGERDTAFCCGGGNQDLPPALGTQR